MESKINDLFFLILQQRTTFIKQKKTHIQIFEVTKKKSPFLLVFPRLQLTEAWSWHFNIKCCSLDGGDDDDGGNDNDSDNSKDDDDSGDDDADDHDDYKDDAVKEQWLSTNQVDYLQVITKYYCYMVTQLSSEQYAFIRQQLSGQQ